MYSAHDVYYAYKKARRNFSLKTYLLLGIWLILALAQWLMVAFIQPLQLAFYKHFYISITFFLLAILIFALFLFFEKLRFKLVVACILSIFIVELQIIAVFTLVAHSYWTEMLLYFAICIVLLAIFVVIGIILPRKVDLTLHVALLFILAFLFLIIAVFFLMLHLIVPQLLPYGYILVQLPITITLLFFVMYHAQTIHGGRFAEMRLHDFFLGSLILFHDFLIIYLLTFYWQSWARLVTLDERDPHELTTGFKAIDLGDDDLDDEINFINMPKRIDRIKSKSDLDETNMKITLDFMKADTASNRFTTALKNNDWPGIFLAKSNRNPVFKPPDSTTTTIDTTDFDYYE